MEFMDAQRKISNFSQREVEDAGEICYNPNWRIFGRRSAINSMTGYGRAARELDGRQLTVELKSVNHRFLDLNLRLPRSFLFLEEEARKRIGKRLSRGHVEGFFTYRNLRRDAKAVTVDEGLLEAYMRSMDGISGLPDDRTLLNVLRLPEVLQISEAEEDREALSTLFADALEGALNELVRMRGREGEALRLDMDARASALEMIAAGIRARYPGTVREYMERLRAGVQELIGQQADEARLLQEVAVMADRAAIDEELVRLSSHIAQLREFLRQPEPAGRKLDFLVQEMNREANTISSKSQDLEITRLAMDAKAEIEKLREQLQNIE